MRPAAIEQNNANGGVAFWDGIHRQSFADRNGVSLADYIHAMYGLIRQAKAREVLLIGCGGGTLATMLTRARVRVTMVDIDPAAFAIARTWFAMPAAITCHTADGATFLRRHAVRYDAIALDAYSGGEIPAAFLKPGFFALARRRLKRGGILVANLIADDGDDRTPDRAARIMQKAFPAVNLLDSEADTDRNLIAVAGAIAHLKPPRLLMRPNRSARRLARELAAFDFRAVR